MQEQIAESEITRTGDDDEQQDQSEPIDEMQLVPLPEKEVRHVGIVWLTQRHLHAMIQAPEGARILDVFTDHMLNAIGIMVESPELPECEEGCRPDDIPAVLYAVPGPDGSVVMSVRYDWAQAKQ